MLLQIDAVCCVTAPQNKKEIKIKTSLSFSPSQMNIIIKNV